MKTERESACDIVGLHATSLCGFIVTMVANLGHTNRLNEENKRRNGFGFCVYVRKEEEESDKLPDMADVAAEWKSA